MLYKRIDLPSEEPVQFVGVYVLKWGRAGEPTVGFREATLEEISAEQLPGSQLSSNTLSESDLLAS